MMLPWAILLLSKHGSPPAVKLAAIIQRAGTAQGPH